MYSFALREVPMRLRELSPCMLDDFGLGQGSQVGRYWRELVERYSLPLIRNCEVVLPLLLQQLVCMCSLAFLHVRGHLLQEGYDTVEHALRRLNAQLGYNLAESTALMIIRALDAELLVKQVRKDALHPYFLIIESGTHNSSNRLQSLLEGLCALRRRARIDAANEPFGTPVWEFPLVRGDSF